MCCSSLDPIIQGLERDQFLICVLDWGLERICLTDLMFLVLEGNLFPSRLTWGLERIFSASTFDHIFDFVGIILFSCDTYAIYHRGLERSQHVTVLLVSSLCVGWGLERSFNAHFPDDSYARCLDQVAMRPPSNIAWDIFAWPDTNKDHWGRTASPIPQDPLCT